MIDIKDIIPFMRKGWVAMDENGEWFWYSTKPVVDEYCWCFGRSIGNNQELTLAFNISPADDWKKSLIKIEGRR